MSFALFTIIVSAYVQMSLSGSVHEHCSDVTMEGCATGAAHEKEALLQRKAVIEISPHDHLAAAAAEEAEDDSLLEEEWRKKKAGKKGTKEDYAAKKGTKEDYAAKKAAAEAATADKAEDDSLL